MVDGLRTNALLGVDETILALGLSEVDYDRVERLINAVSARIERYCRTKFKKRTETIKLTGGTGPILNLGAPLATTDGLVVKIGGVAVTDYTAMSERGELYRDGGWLSYSILSGWGTSINNVEVTAQFGYDPLPDDAKEAALITMRYLFSNEGREGMQSESIGGEYSYTKFLQQWERGGSALLPPEATDLLEDFVRWA